MPLKIHKCGITLAVKLTPKAAKNSLVRLEQNSDGKTYLKATVTAIPEKGKANAALIKLISKKLGLPKTKIQIIAGEQSRHKTLLFTGDPISLMRSQTEHLKTLGLAQ